MSFAIQKISQGAIFVSILISVILSVTLFCKIKNNDKFKAFKELCFLDKGRLERYYNSYDIIYNNDDISNTSTKEDFDKDVEACVFKVNSDKTPSGFVEDLYSIINLLCTLGNVQKMYIPPLLNPTKGLIDNQILYEQQIIDWLNVKPNGIILDIGCGSGRIAHHISKVTNCKVYGTNIDRSQLNNAKEYAKSTGFENKTQFLFHDYNDKFPFEDNSIDGIYSVQALCGFVTNFDKVFGELFRILKPGGRLVSQDDVILDNFDKKNPHHLKLLKGYQQIGCAGAVQYYKYWPKTAEKNCFKMIHSKGGEAPHHARELSLLKKENALFEKLQNRIVILGKLKLIPSHLSGLLDRLRKCVEDMIEIEELDLLTMTWDYCAEKPLTPP